LHDRLVELVVTARVTVPANPLMGATVIVEVAGERALPVTPVGLAERVKSGLVTALSCIVTELVGMLLLEPSTINSNDPG
jgi:hypothetical protein